MSEKLNVYVSIYNLNENVGTYIHTYFINKLKVRDNTMYLNYRYHIFGKMNTIFELNNYN